MTHALMKSFLLSTHFQITHAPINLFFFPLFLKLISRMLLLIFSFFISLVTHARLTIFTHALINLSFFFFFFFLFFSFFLFFFHFADHACSYKFFKSRMLLLIFSLSFFSFLITHALKIIFRSTHAPINIFPFTISPITHALIIFFFFSKSSYITHAFINLFSLHNLFQYYACTYKYVHSFSIHF